MAHFSFFTQTKPASSIEQSAETQWNNMRKALAGPSDALIEVPESPLERMPSSTEKDTSSAPPLTSSPTQTTQSFTRLRRRASPDFGDSEIIEPKRTAFDKMMAASNRREERKAAVKSNLIDVQAEESDEDGGWAPIGGGEDEDDDAEDEGYLQDLVDDQAVDEDEKKRQDDLAATKLREIQQADDAKREAEAKKIIEGQHRTKKRGMDFLSDDEDDEEGGKRRKWSKKERRKRRLEKEDGLDKLGESHKLTISRGGTDWQMEKPTPFGRCTRRIWRATWSRKMSPKASCRRTWTRSRRPFTTCRANQAGSCCGSGLRRTKEYVKPARDMESS